MLLCQTTSTFELWTGQKMQVENNKRQLFE
ncbi:hypothetical protein [Bacillus sp. EB600]